MAKPSVATAKAAPAAKEKAPKVAAAAKAPKVAKESSEKASARAEHMSKKINVLFKENPGREGTKAFDARAKYKNGMTVREYIDAGGDPGYVRHDVAKGLISLK